MVNLKGDLPAAPEGNTRETAERVKRNFVTGRGPRMWVEPSDRPSDRPFDGVTLDSACRCGGTRGVRVGAGVFCRRCGRLTSVAEARPRRMGEG